MYMLPPKHSRDMATTRYVAERRKHEEGVKEREKRIREQGKGEALLAYTAR
jgi:hypothetical protein